MGVFVIISFALNGFHVVKRRCFVAFSSKPSLRDVFMDAVFTAQHRAETKSLCSRLCGRTTTSNIKHFNIRFLLKIRGRSTCAFVEYLGELTVFLFVLSGCRYEIIKISHVFLLLGK